MLMFRFLLVAAAFNLATTAVPAQDQASPTFQYDAIIGRDGEVQLVPKEGSDTRRIPAVEGYEDAIGAEMGRATVTTADLFLVKDAEGLVKGAFPTQEALTGIQLDAGDVVEVLPVKEGTEFMGMGASATPVDDDSYFEGIAREAGKKLMSAVVDVACGLDRSPESVTPTVEVSFGIFGAGGSLSVSATWQVSDLPC